MTSSLAQSSMQFSFSNHAATSLKFLPLDLCQSSSIYNLYAASADAVVAANTSSLFNPTLVQKIASQTCNNNSTTLLEKEALQNSKINIKNTLHSPLTYSSNKKNLVDSLELIQKTIPGSAFKQCFLENSAVSLNNDFSKSKIIKITKTNYFNTNQQIVSSSTNCESLNYAKNCKNNSSFVTSRLIPSSSSISMPVQRQVNVIVNGPSLISTPLLDLNTSLGNFYDKNISLKNVNEKYSSSASPSNVNFVDNLHQQQTSTKFLVDKKKKELIRDDAYWERRRKNNDAAKRSRDSRRKKEDEVAIRAAILEQENLTLRFEIKRLKSEIERYRFFTINTEENDSKNSNKSQNIKKNNCNEFAQKKNFIDTLQFKKINNAILQLSAEKNDTLYLPFCQQERKLIAQL